MYLSSFISSIIMLLSFLC